MLESTRLQLERNALDTEIARASQFASDAEDYEVRLGEYNNKLGQREQLDLRIVDATKTEDRDAQAAMSATANPDGWTPELREFHELGQRTSILEYMQAGLQQRHLRAGTPEHEYNSHVFDGNWNIGDYPLEMLLDRREYFDLDAHQAGQVQERELEQRTAITGVVSTAGNLSFVDRIFASSEGAYCRGVYPAVGPGRHSYPIVTGVADVGVAIARGTGETVAGGLTVVNADPERIQHSFEVARIDELQMPGIMAYIVSDIRAGLIGGLDKKVIVDLLAGLGAAAVHLTGTTTINAATMFGAIATGVDGIGARYFNEVRVLAQNNALIAQTSFYEKAISFIAAADNAGAFDWFANLRASAQIPAVDGGHGEAVLIKMAPSAPRLIVPTWRRAEILRDTGRLQLRGEVTLTGALYADVIVAATDMHDWISVDTE